MLVIAPAAFVVSIPPSVVTISRVVITGFLLDTGKEQDGQKGVPFAPVRPSRRSPEKTWKFLVAQTAEHRLTSKVAGSTPVENFMLERLSQQLKVEKERRVYYQSIVYDICNILDRHRTDGKKTVCGTVGTPSTDLQQTLQALLPDSQPGVDPNRVLR